MTEPTRELRLALGMRGGVSLAVWIGGACAEIDQLRRSFGSDAPAPERSDFWSGLRAVSEYDAVVVDVLAGASAGGLNGAIYATSLVYDFSLDSMREIWLDAGGTNKLIRSSNPYLSLFDGDGVFLQQVYAHLETSVPPPNDAPASGGAERVALSLSATLLEPIARLGTSPKDEQQWERRSAGGFHFEHHAETWRGNDFAPGSTSDPERRLRALARLGLAARSTSSFPAAFEPAVVHSGRRATFSPTAAPAGTSTPEPTDASLPGGVDLDGAFLDRRTDGTFLVADGGILDNIPLERAIRDIVTAPAGGPTHRVLLYLQPGAPSHHTQAAAVAAGKRRAVPALGRGIVRAFRTEETISQDMAALEHHTESIDRAHAIRGATFARLLATNGTPRQQFTTAAASATVAYRQLRGAEDALATLALLSDPLATLGHDPFPANVAGESVSDDSWRSPLGQCSPGQRAALASALWNTFDVATKGDVLRVGIGPVQRVARILLDWTWYLEESGADVGTLKRALYRIANFADVVLDGPRQWAWISAAARTMNPVCSIDPRKFVDDCLAWTNDLYRLDPAADATALHAALLSGDNDTPVVTFRDHVLGRVDDVVAGIVEGGSAASPSALSPADDVRNVLLGLLTEIAEQLRAQTPAATPEGSLHSGRVLDECLGGSQEIDESTLLALEVLCYPEFVAGAPCQSAIEFHRLSAANRFVIASTFTALLDAAEAQNKWWDPKNKNRATQRGIHVDLKLAGNELNNFSAFLLPEWRSNDWLWGRLDAVPTLLDLIVTPSSLRARGITGKAELATIRELAVPDTPSDVQAQMNGFFEPRVSAIEDELEALADPTKPDASITNIRDVLVARRQWEILGEELRMLRRPADEAARPGTRPLVRDAADGQAAITLAEAVSSYDSGAQTTRSPEGTERATDRATALHDRVGELVDRGAEFVLDNLDQNQGGPLPVASLGANQRKLAVGGLRIAGTLASRQILPGTRSDHGLRWKIALAVGVAIVVAAVVYALTRDILAFAIGLVVPLVIVILLVVVLWRAAQRKPAAKATTAQ